jgi:hypothetical protein
MLLVEQLVLFHYLHLDYKLNNKIKRNLMQHLQQLELKELEVQRKVNKQQKKYKQLKMNKVKKQFHSHKRKQKLN